MFELISSMTIKIMEQTLSLGQDNEELNLINPRDILNIEKNISLCILALFRLLLNL